MTPGPEWPAIKNPLAISAEDHAAHRSPRGTATAEQVTGDVKMTKMAKLSMKYIHKKHLSLKGKMPRRRKKP